ncbi:hypothetical protein [Pantoea cypripedii]|uniref:Conjugal transfer protein TraS n=1 Tax=Pantoea cypripedii TaxID=55209 RepID=A0A6B9G4S9_PANCY|nr:hypothetical protein [Pantoea cypripedii]QGY32524.1 hypothetical protein CUN67_26550 [Pantoea cypripedii]
MMAMTYDQIEKESKEIITLLSNSNKEVPSFFSFFEKIKYHFSIYVIFLVATYFSYPKAGFSPIWLVIVFFGLFHWFVLCCFVFSWSNIFAMADPALMQKFCLSRLIARKLRAYGIAWLIFLVVAGVASVLTVLNIFILVAGNFIFTFFMFFTFNLDISRYQLAGVLGAIEALREKFDED